MDALNVANTHIVYSREKEKKLAERQPVPPEYMDIMEIFAGMVSDINNIADLKGSISTSIVATGRTIQTPRSTETAWF